MVAAAYMSHPWTSRVECQHVSAVVIIKNGMNKITLDKGNKLYNEI